MKRMRSAAAGGGWMVPVLAAGVLAGCEAHGQEAGAGAEAAGVAARMESGPRFPALSGSTLSGRKLRLPGDFEGELNLVFVAFERDQQPMVDTWVPFAREVAFRVPELRFYELPTIARGYVLIRPIIEGGMRGGVTEPAARDTTITLYTDTGAFRRALGLPHGRTIYALLLDRAGTVRWRAEGAFTDQKGAELRSAVERLLAEGP